MRNKKIGPMSLTAILMILVCFGVLGPFSAKCLEDGETACSVGNLGQPFRYPNLPQREFTPDYVFTGKPNIIVEPTGRVTIEFKTVVPTSNAKVYYGLYVPQQEIKVPQYRKYAREKSGGESGFHIISFELKDFKKDKYDLCNFKEKGGAICYRIEVSAPTMEDQIAFCNGRFRVDGNYKLLPCIIEGPFVDQVTADSAVISWETEVSTKGWVEVDGKKYSDRKIFQPQSIHHEITVRGLSPDKEYGYEVFTGGIKDFKSYHFKTAPTPENSNFMFVYMSDSREGVGGGERAFCGVNYYKLSGFMRDAYNKGTDFILFGGDLVNGYTTNEVDFRMQLKVWKQAAEQIGCYIPIYEGMGNHEALMDLYSKPGMPKKVDICETPGVAGFDKKAKSAEAVFAEEFVNPTGSCPERETRKAPSYSENVYYFNWGNTRIVSFNTNYWWCTYPEDFGGNLEGYVMDNQLVWIEKVLDDAKKDSSIEHVFMFGHEPAFPNGGHLKDAQWYEGGAPGKGRNHDFEGKFLDRSYLVQRRDRLWEAISQNGKVVAVFFGDSHNYHRTLINSKTPVHLNGSPNQNFINPVWQIISGGAGAPFYAQENAPWSGFVEYFYPSKNYCMIHVNGDTVKLRAISDSGEIIDECVLKQKTNPEQVHLSWSTNDVYHSMTAMWFTEFPAASSVLYDLVPKKAPGDYAFSCRGSPHQISSFDGWYHETELTGLEPGKTYYFRVGGPGGYSREWNFRTIGLDQQVGFVVGGDSRRPHHDELKSKTPGGPKWPGARDRVTSCVAREDPDFVVFIGDMVLEGNDQEHWNNWFESIQDRLVTSDGRMIPLVAVIGNHEMGAYPDVDSSYEWFRGVFANPGNELCYSLDFPNLHLTALSATGGCVGTWWQYAVPEAKAQTDWLEKDLAESDAKWKVVTWHVPYYSGFLTGTGYPSDVFLKYWALIVEKPEYGVDLVVNGHVHNYMRSWSLRTTGIEEVPADEKCTDVGYEAHYKLVDNSSEGVTYIVQGCWGAPIEPYVKGGDCDLREFVASAAARPSYTLVELADDGVHVLTKDVWGEVVDDFRLPYLIT